MKQNGLQDSATERNGERQNQAFKSNEDAHPKRVGLQAAAVKRPRHKKVRRMVRQGLKVRWWMGKKR